MEWDHRSLNCTNWTCISNEVTEYLPPSCKSDALVCSDCCGPLHWDFMGPNLVISFGLWVALLFGGIAVNTTWATSNVEECSMKLQYWKRRLHASTVYCLIFLGCGLAQCGIFCFRTYSQSVDIITFGVEIFACFIYLLNVVVCWAQAQMAGYLPGIRYVCSGAIVDCLLVPSVVFLALNKVDGVKTWYSLSFLAGIHVVESWHWLLHIFHVNLQVLQWQVIYLVVSAIALIFFAAMTIMTLENLGDPEILKRANDGRWNTISSLYYVFVSISTVGYGDLAPATALGRVCAVVTIFGGIVGLIFGIRTVVQVIAIHGQGGGSFALRGVRSRHVVVVGEPTVQTMKDFVSELYHPDHSDEAEDLHIVFLLPRGSGAAVDKILAHLTHKSNIHVAPLVHVLQGSVLDRLDLHRVSMTQAITCFVLPNTSCKDFMHEDTENIIRMTSVLQFVPHIRIVLLLMKAEHRQLIYDTGASSITCLAIDQFKLELVGKQCQVPGFSTFICNLCKTTAVPENEELDEDLSKLWMKEYEHGMGNELYEVELSPTYADRASLFSEVVLDVIEQTEGRVYLIGIVETWRGESRVMVNPGAFYPIKKVSTGVLTSGIFIAADREAIVQCEGGQVFLGRKERPFGSSTMDKRPSTRLSDQTSTSDNAPAPGRGGSGGSMKSVLQVRRTMQVEGAEKVLKQDTGMTQEQQERARKLLRLVRQQESALAPSRPPMKLLARGGHILFLCVSAQGSDDLRIGLEHFVEPLRGAYSTLVPIVVLAPVAPRDWHTVSEYKEVFFIKGSPLSLFDLERVNFREANVIFICHVGCSGSAQLREPWMVDSEELCCVRLVESQLPSDSATAVVMELTFEMNHPFVPPPRSSMDQSRNNQRAALRLQSDWAGRKTARKASPSCCGRLQGALAALCCRQGHADMGEEDSSPGALVTEYYRQPRYACGQLFVGNVVTSLAVNTFFNPSLAHLINVMIASHVVTVEVTREWEGKMYYEYFDHLLWDRQLMPIGIFRERSVVKTTSCPHTRRWAYVYTAPPAKETPLSKTDKVICFGAATTADQTAGRVALTDESALRRSA